MQKIELRYVITELEGGSWIRSIILIQISLRFIDQMSTPAPPAEPAKLNKVQLLNDVLAFGSIVSAFLFLSHTLEYNYLGALLGETRQAGDIVLLYLLYALLIVILKTVAAAIRWKNPDNQFAKELEAAISRSLFAITAIVAVHIIALQSRQGADVAVLCQIAWWLLVAELNIIFCGLLAKIPAFQSLSLFGWTIEAILVLGQLLSFAGFDFFEVL